MQTELLSDPITQYFLLFSVGLIVGNVVLRHYPALRLTSRILFFAALTLLLLHHGIEPYASDPSHAEDVSRRVLVGLAKAVWWIGGALVLVSFVRLFLIFERKPREGRLLQDLVVGLIYLGASLSIVAYVFSVPVGTLIATSGVFAVILGLALQSTLNDVFSGIALNLGRPYTVGDWIVLDDGVQGRVVETNWRATHLLNGTNDLVIIPNSGLAKSRLVNLSSPDETHGISLTVKIVPVRPPAAIEEVMRTVLLSSNTILKNPPPAVTIRALDNQVVELELSCRVKDISLTTRATNEIYDLVFRHCKAAGLPLASQPGVAASPVVDKLLEPLNEQQAGTPWRLLSAMPLFAPLTDDEKEAVAVHMTRKTYRQNTVIAEQGEKLASLMVVRSGVVVISRREAGREIELTRLSPGDCFGEGGVLVDAEEAGTARALTFVVVYEIKQDFLAGLMHDRPILAEELGLLLSRRSEAERHLIGLADGLSNGRHLGSFASRIRHLFQLQHDQV
ncbi:cyclic nucleotide-binding domain-containing protein [Rhizobium sp. BK251]|uniref:cyclic nucleotide-binding domain-containing protein n=1 Tax=Rhizobium sp. BK251 TaxID=2512125 RepID=UPI0010501124|nr:cyclic nucleotide-binding domain-containing protein [Rhizobium sp. BK251]